jgi:hypothetical protein
MSTEDKSDEATEFKTRNTEDEEVEGHVGILHSDDAPSDDLSHSVRHTVRAQGDDDDVEGHHLVRQSSDPDFTAQTLSHSVRAKDDDEDVEGHVKVR